MTELNIAEAVPSSVEIFLEEPQLFEVGPIPGPNLPPAFIPGVTDAPSQIDIPPVEINEPDEVEL